jgi:type IV secretory pathway VirB2 component (pilin)
MFGFVQIEMSLADPPGSSVVLAATDWVQGTLLGTLATIVAVIAVAAIGFLMLLGRVDLRRGATVLFGCFVLFGAPVIAKGLRGIISGSETVYATSESRMMKPLVIPPPPPQPKPNAVDPYAGAAIQR